MVTVIWGSAFVAQRFAAIRMDILLFNGFRYLVGTLILIPLAWTLPRRQPSNLDDSRQTKMGIFLAGVMLFAGATLQQWGLRYTTAGNAGFITGLYVVLVPLLLAVFWRQKPRQSIVIAALVAAVGLFLLSTGGILRLNPGDVLELGGAFLWAGHVILIGWLAQRANVFQIAIGQNLTCGLLSLGVFVLLAQPDSWLGLHESWWTIVYTGVLSIGIGYTLQIVGQREAPPSDAAIILSGEAVFAALFGWWWLNEQLSGVQLLGCGLILAGMLLAQMGSKEESTQGMGAV